MKFAKRLLLAPFDLRAQSANPRMESFQAGGKPVAVERFEPAGSGRRPAVVLLHGSDGLEQHRPVYLFGAQTLVNEAYRVFLVHYLDRTQTKIIAPDAITRPHFEAWLDTAREGVLHVRRQVGMDPRRIGVVGFSLGAYLAVATASQEDWHVDPVVDFCGGLPRELYAQVKTLQPTLVIHGDADATVPVREAYTLQGLLQTRAVPHEVRIHKKQSHLFMNDPFGPDATYVRKQALRFLGCI